MFKHEKLPGKRQAGNKKLRKNLLPTFIAITALGLAIGLFLLQPNGGRIFGVTSSGEQNESIVTHTQQDIGTIFHLKNKYIGDSGAMGEIASRVLGDYKRNGIALQTNEEPYGLIIPAQENIPSHIQLKLAFYVFSLIPNSGYVTIEHGESVETISRQSLEETYNLNLTAIETEEDLLTSYYDTLASYGKLTQIQTNREDSYKYLFNALNDGTIMLDMQTKDLPDITFVFEDNSYSLWIRKEEIWLMKHDDPYKFHVVKGERYVELKKFLTNDAVVGDGIIIEISGDRLLIADKDKETGELDAGSIWVGVDAGSSYQIGEKIKAWSNAVDESYPAQAGATKIQRQ